MIVEMAGRPAVHLTESLEKHIGVLKNVNGIEIHSIKCSEPRKIPDPEGKTVPEEQIMFTSFAEADFETESFNTITQIMFDFMPSSVEVTHPSKVTLSATEATDLLNNISGRLHRYDEFAKIAGNKMQTMNAQLLKAKEILTARDAEIAQLRNGAVAKIISKGKATTKKPVKKPAKKKTASKKKK